MQKELNDILELFPAYRRKIIELYNSNEDFQLLCEDYWQCKNALSKFRQHLQEDAKTENEYMRMCEDLEHDALRFLEKID